jgi:HAD superfamily hydrolase (TIGR01459 family)
MKLQQLSAQYPVWLCDIWGVVHDGHHAITSAVEALYLHRKAGGKVVLITNAPRPKFNVLAQLQSIGVTSAAFDDIVSSGDVTRSLMEAQGEVFHIGPRTDQSLFERTSARRVAVQKAKAVVCSGYFEDRAMNDDAYMPEFEAMLARKLVMICANPDKVVRIGKHLVLCAGTLADAYAAMGGEVLMAGKPFTPIYDLALQKAGNPPRDKVMVIGDGPETDVKGAALQGFPCYFVSGGINSASDIEAKVRAEFPAVNIVGSAPELRWA